MELNKPLVLVIENSVDFTGGLNSILRSCEMLKDHFEFHFILPAGGKSFLFVQEKGFLVYEWRMKEIRKNVLAMFIYLPILIYNSIKLHRKAKRLKVDLIVSNDFYNIITPLFKLIGGKVPYVCYVRFLPSKFPSYLVRLWNWLHNRYASSIIAVSNAAKMELPYRDKVVIIGNELPNKEIDYVNSTSHLILYPANYINGKGHEYGLQCFARIHAKYPSWRLRFIGNDMGLKKNLNYKNGLVEKSYFLGLRNAVEFSGFSSNMENEYMNASIVLNFSESESFSLTCLEAMFYGRSIVATKSGGPQEIISEGENGILVDVNDITSMTRALDDLMGNAEMRNRLSRNGYESVRKKFALEEIKKQLLTVYWGACSREKKNN